MSSNPPDPNNPSGQDSQDKADREKTLEMRVAELEDKLSNVYITEEEFKTYRKVSSLLINAASPRGIGGSANALLLADACIPWALGVIVPFLDLSGRGGRAPEGAGEGGGFESLGK
jgi:hypothetical protein